MISAAPRAAARLAAVGLAAGLSACAADRAVTGSTYPHDVPQRHPIVLAESARTLDVFVTSAGGLDPRQRDDVRAFAEEYRRYGQGALVAQAPAGTRHALSLHMTLDGIRAALAAGGVPSAHLSVASYVPADPMAAAPVRLSFQRLKAKVESKCGLWPQDLGVSDAGFNNRNETYWNFGCAMQTNVAAQVADPVDLVRGRQEGRIDTVRRSRDFESIRQGKDPSTTYRQDEKGKISSFGQ
ncbi:MAG TPA: CpaD family pilus assembly protein [Beijerinckiaceae bacterium]|jgi:pilus assembly protein CpaD